MNRIHHKLLGMLTAVLLIGGLLTSAAAADFSDVADADTARSLDVLQALGIVEGYPDGSYRPDEMLTRAQFCKFAVLLMDLEDQLLSASQKTLFSDVTSEHWAAPYVNLAYGNSLIQGYGNGMFGPDDNITYEQAVTISLRILGYESSDIGNYYPDDYLRFADKLGLTDSLERVAGEALTRAEAAELLYSLLNCKTKNGSVYAAKLADKTVSSVILLDNETASPTGLLHSAKFYSGGQAVWYSLAAELDASLIGAEGTALLNEDNALIGFLPDTVRYTVVDGILLANSLRTAGAAGSAYSVKLYTDSGTRVYPRANTISANLIGSSGTLILNENGYASAFISDDSAVYNLTNDAILVNVSTVSGNGVSGCAEFLVNSKSVYYQNRAQLSSSLIGRSGTILTDDAGNLIDFLPEENTYSLLSGICVGSDSGEASFLIGGSLVSYPTAVSIAGSQIGSEGMILLNEQGYVSAFLADTDKKYTIVTDAVLLNSNVLSDVSYTCGADFYINGKSAWYAYSGSYTDPSYTDYCPLYGFPASEWYSGLYSSAGQEGILVLDRDNCITEFIPTGERYYLLTGILTDTSTSYYGKTVTLYTGGQSALYTAAAAISSGNVGSYGTLMLNPMGYAIAFIPDESTHYSMSQSGILLSVGTVADDGITTLVKMYVNGNIVPYAISGPLSESGIGTYGRLLLDQNGRAVGFIRDTDSSSQSAAVVSASETALITVQYTYAVRSNLTVITAERTVSTWSAVYSSVPAGSSVTLYFDSLGSLTLMMIG